jgi:hypothetical protein
MRQQCDIRLYIERELANHDEKLSARAMDIIIKKSEALFLYADWIRSEVAHGRLSLERIEEFPQGLGGIYHQFFTRQFQDLVNYKQTYRPVLEVIIAAFEPQRLETLGFMFGWDKYTLQEILTSFGSLFTVVDSCLRPFHLSVASWLNDPARSGVFYVSIASGHRRLVEWLWGQRQAISFKMDPYGLAFLPSHLAASKEFGRLAQLFLDPAYVRARSDLFQFSWLTEYGFWRSECLAATKRLV